MENNNFYIFVQCYDQFSESEMISLIPDSKRQEIFNQDKHPFFKAYVVSHTGESNMTEIENKNGFISKKKEIIEWSKNAITQFYDKLKTGLKFFIGHNKDNSTENRKSIGEIVAKASKYIDGKLSNIVIGYFPESTREIAKKSDVVSFEGAIKVASDGVKKFVENISDITGIALANSKDVSTGFSNSVALAQVQFYDVNENSNSTLQNTVAENNSKKEVKKMAENEIDISTLSPEQRQKILMKHAALAEIKNAISYRRLRPGDLFDIEDRFPKMKIESGKIKLVDASTSEQEYFDRISDAFKNHYSTDIEESKKKLSEYENKLKLYSQKEKRELIKPELKKYIESKTIDPRVKDIILKRIESKDFLSRYEVPDDPINTNNLIGTIYNNAIEEYEYNSKLYGIAAPDNKENKNETDAKTPPEKASAIEKYLSEK